MMDVRPHLLRDEGGTTLVEVIVAAVMLVVIAGSITSMVVAAQTSSGQQRVQAVAADLAQSTLEDLRSRKFTHLMNLDATTAVTAGGVEYSVRSVSQWAMQGASGATGCEGGSSGGPAALRLSTIVTWPDMKRAPVRLDTLVPVPVGAASRRGNLVVQISNAQGIGVPGVAVSLDSMSRSTDATGCVRFGGVGEGTYTLTFSKAGYVTPALLNVHSEQVAVVAGQTRNVSKEYDVPGTARIRFVTAAPTVTAQLMSAAVFKAVGVADAGFAASPAGTQVTTVDRAGLYPAASGYQVFTDSCATGFPASAAVPVPSGGMTPTRVDITVPTVRFDLDRLPNGAVLDGKIVSACGTAFTLAPFTTTTNNQAVVRDLPVPAGLVQSICVHYRLGTTDYRREWTDAATRTVDQPVETISASMRTNQMAVGTCP